MHIPIAVAATLLLLAGPARTPARAQSPAPGGTPPPSGMSLAQSAAMRFPQPVRVGDLPGRPVLQPVEAQTELGRVRAVVRNGAGDLWVVVELSEWFGLHTRTIAVPVDATVLVGDAVEIVAYTPAQLWQRPVFDPAGTTPMDPDATIEVGLAKPSH